MDFDASAKKISKPSKSIFLLHCKVLFAAAGGKFRGVLFRTYFLLHFLIVVSMFSVGNLKILSANLRVRVKWFLYDFSKSRSVRVKWVFDLGG